jgi:outer membrane protein
MQLFLLTEREKTMKKTLTLALAAAIAGGGAAAQAYEKGDWLVRVGYTVVDPDTNSDDINLPGLPTLEAKVDHAGALGIIPARMLTDHFGLELLAATPFIHDISVKGAGGLSVDAGSTKQLPPTLSLQWYPRGGHDGWQPYLGVGVNYTYFFSEDVDRELKGVLGGVLGASRANLELDDSWGLAGQAGIDIPLGDNWGLNLGVWYINIDSTATIRTDVGNVKFDVEIDPWVYNAGLFVKF